MIIEVRYNSIMCNKLKNGKPMGKVLTQTNELSRRKNKIPTLSGNTWQDQIKIETTALHKIHHQIWTPKKMRSLRNKIRKRKLEEN